MPKSIEKAIDLLSLLASLLAAQEVRREKSIVTLGDFDRLAREGS